MDAKIAVVSEDHCDPHDLLFGIRRSIRYHNHRRQFFDLLDRGAKILGVISGSATITTVLGKMNPVAVTISAVVVAVVSAFDLIIEPSQASRLHYDLSRRFIALEQETILQDRVTKARLNELCAKRLEIEADEPPILRILDTICHNELLRAMGYDKKLVIKVRRIQRICANLLDWDEASACPLPDGDSRQDEDPKPQKI